MAGVRNQPVRHGLPFCVCCDPGREERYERDRRAAIRPRFSSLPQVENVRRYLAASRVGLKLVVCQIRVRGKRAVPLVEVNRRG